MNNIMKSKLIFFTALAVFLLNFVSCKKPAGEGGRAFINGKVYVKNYNAAFTAISSEYYGQGENVYITYGDNTVVGNNTKTSYDGSYEFPYLRKGKYKIFVVSKDLTSSATISVIKEVEITERKQVINLPDLVIIK